MKKDKIQVRIEDRVAIITLSDPPDNGIGMDVTKGIVELLEQYETDNEVRCIMLTHLGPNFSNGAGADEMPYYEQGMECTEIGKLFRPAGKALVDKLDNYPKPTIAVGAGNCVGAAYVIFNACDIRIAGESFKLYNGDMYWGTASDWGMTATRLPIWLGRNKVLDFVFLDETFNARQLYELGMVSKVVPDPCLQEVGWLYAKKLATTSPLSVRYFKECLRRAVYSNLSLEEKVAKEIEAADIVMASEDARNSTKMAMLTGKKYDFQGK